MDGPIAVLILFAAIVGGIALMAWTFSRARQILEQWAQSNGYQILSSEFRWLRKGPFFWTSSQYQMIYYVTVQTPTGDVRSGWVRCGGFWLGLFTDQAQVRWED